MYQKSRVNMYKIEQYIRPKVYFQFKRRHPVIKALLIFVDCDSLMAASGLLRLFHSVKC